MRYIILALLGIFLVGLPVFAHSADDRDWDREWNATKKFNITRVTGVVEFVSSDVVQVRGKTYNIWGVMLESESGDPLDRGMLAEGARIRLHVDMRDNSVIKMVLLRESRPE